MSEYTIEKCSQYKKEEIKGIPVYIFDEHNMALPAWGTVASRAGQGLNLLTFDSHTDTFNAFLRMVKNSQPGEDTFYNAIVQEFLSNKKYSLTDFCFGDVFVIGHSLWNDEHIKAACRMGYLNSYFVVHRQISASTYHVQDQYDGFNATYVYTDDFCAESVNGINAPIALDFDLDYFINAESFSPVITDAIAQLKAKIQVITIAREPRYYGICCKESGLSVDESLSKLLELLKSFL